MLTVIFWKSLMEAEPQNTNPIDFGFKRNALDSTINSITRHGISQISLVPDYLTKPITCICIYIQPCNIIHCMLSLLLYQCFCTNFVATLEISLPWYVSP